MPHFVIDCSENLTALISPQEIMQKVYETAERSTLFEPDDIKVRINSFKNYKIGVTKDSFIHVFANIMEGRTGDQKSLLSKSVVKELKSLLPRVSIISMNIRDFEKTTYYNRSML